MRSKIFMMLTLGWMLLLPNKGAAFGTCCDPCAVWTGAYIGINGGYVCGKTDYHFPKGGGGSASFIGVTDLFAPYFGGGHFRQKSNGGVLGAQFGYNKQCGCLVLSVECSFDGAWLKKTSHNPIAGMVPVAERTYETKTHWFATSTPRIGYACDCWLLYVKGGFAATRISSSLHSNQAFTFGTLTGNGLSFSQKHYHYGWTVGVGVEYVWCRYFVVGIEYDHHKFRKPTYGGAPNPDTTWPIQYKISPHYNLVLVRFSYKC